MIISALKVLELNEKYNLVEGLGERDSKNPEGVGLDLRVGKVEKLTSGSLLCADNTSRKRYSPKTELIGDIERDGNKVIIMKPGDFYLVSTMETVHAPAERVKIHWFLPGVHLMPDVYPRTSLQRGGVDLLATKTDPGYRGPLAFGLKNVGNQDFEFELGARMFNLVYHVILGRLKRPYSGQHQGGRITSGGKIEIQT